MVAPVSGQLTKQITRFGILKLGVSAMISFMQSMVENVTLGSHNIGGPYWVPKIYLTDQITHSVVVLGYENLRMI